MTCSGYPTAGFRFKAPSREPAISVANSFPHCLRDSRLKTVHGPKDRSPLNGVPVWRPLWNRARDALRVTPIHQLHLPSVKSTFRVERPVGRQPTFVTGYRTLIHPITGWHSLLPTSHARTPIGSPYGSLSPTGGENTGFPSSAC